MKNEESLLDLEGLSFVPFRPWLMGEEERLAMSELNDLWGGMVHL